ncbi:MAG TPA: ankyrin repeat domain-containing protein [Candidatus Acidoferrales bacterium]|nr:ankyrin repeat domain-containing protein [Candidatus Acidoferrales bacterium]
MKLTTQERCGGLVMTEDSTKKLLEAIRGGDKVGLEALLRKEPELLRFAAPNGSSVVLLAAYYGHAELVEIFVRHGVKLDVFEASATGNFERVRELVKENAGLVNAFAADGFFPLGLAAFFGHRAIVEFLLKHGADVNTAARNPQKVTSLHGAVARRDVEIVKMLLERGANPNAMQERGFVPLHDAAGNGNLALVQLLVKHGARVDAKADDGKTPGDMAAERGHKELAEWLEGKKKTQDQR